ncbi:DUF2165 domain-containing protein [Roseibium sp. MMSF_3544]|uniref:DUF2165 domain-containing protein n=1 Tax=unclassified Roseibium TaxID=2629323 RepID=UPI0027402773|nr:DUF2165 domain-containing protein [Roseibium sp. MMSF_3544]
MLLTTEFSLRLAKVLITASISLFAFVAGLSNVFDPDTNLRFVIHVMNMDSVFPDNAFAWRAVENPVLHKAAFWFIVAVELVVAVLLLTGSLKLLQNLRGSSQEFHDAKTWAVLGLLLGVLLWFTGFMVIGGEWFLMWQSETWNGIPSSFRFTAVIFLNLLFLATPESFGDSSHKGMSE